MSAEVLLWGKAPVPTHAKRAERVTVTFHGDPDTPFFEQDKPERNWRVRLDGRELKSFLRVRDAEIEARMEARRHGLRSFSIETPSGRVRRVKIGA